ncbi:MULTISPECIES: tRNA (adenosine(37)-N6)-threonylcarbamoyltransferase complex ATPase subunit type 1 TsaE [unclassified Snodgrassella]|uniref:tRNA (adenosine(37)-N6)-threonylcarbamoyltransferase complex ATPase subunit type 1 TsaE n=1 Tax=unclassified Snodgrassella TaxID=2625236 RepID=UPI0018DE6DD1|nr:MULTISPECIES: tRNA (adenosine(37)-N6)-threonylcarbamoyltransferase complex ATPase subunit type 1 TsaE [unclassified Snodgrassella]MBI0067547.1 tRNA (adenosine(37)-N6)-threonylcarbamoyltransferase complex ATPase subunit type 1 TsaE [Snodgrassella sp. M0110]MBI0076489.1 tRNA (adenosine(37)-N6)-threonylcarbamoyltransferase complex ATPase subunit type 1 TsaE [Snodgrassella sp. M0118]MBI0078847.1 tRNA (adenosine(37)-N6)-threonylcarbamoyltransferase complex ATPase subunit type 1 TsaE [Snodgrassella
MPASEIREFFLADENNTLQLSKCFAQHISSPLIIWLEGDLGAGKTTFTRGLLNALGYNGAVKSPTYNIVETYFFNGFNLNHFDLYRFQSPEEWLDAGLDELITADSINLIEWPQLGGDLAPPADIILNITVSSSGRTVQINAVTAHGINILNKIIE